ncbi:MAG: DUF4190 domain-containing protein [Microthrixaceae bacterium]
MRKDGHQRSGRRCAGRRHRKPPASRACFLGILGGIIAIVLGVMGRSKAQRENGNGSGMATAGIVTGAVAILATSLLVALTVFGTRSTTATSGSTPTRPTACVTRTASFRT